MDFLSKKENKKDKIPYSVTTYSYNQRLSA